MRSLGNMWLFQTFSAALTQCLSRNVGMFEGQCQLWCDFVAVAPCFWGE